MEEEKLTRIQLIRRGIITERIFNRPCGYITDFLGHKNCYITQIDDVDNPSHSPCPGCAFYYSEGRERRVFEPLGELVA